MSFYSFLYYFNDVFGNLSSYTFHLLWDSFNHNPTIFRWSQSVSCEDCEGGEEYILIEAYFVFVLNVESSPEF